MAQAAMDKAGPALIETCAALDESLDHYKQQYEAEFSRDWHQAHASLVPIRERLRVLEAEVDELSVKEAAELERAAPEIQRIEPRKRAAEKWANEQRQQSAEQIRRLHQPAADPFGN